MSAVVNNGTNSHINNIGLTDKLSDAAREIIQGKTRFTQYISPEVWPLCRQDFQNKMTPYSDKAKEELLQGVEEKQINGCRVLELTPKTFKEDHKIIIYIHGGAFTLGAPDYLMHIPAPVAHTTGWKVIAVDYPLAPYSNTQDLYPAHTAVFNVYQELLKEYNHSEIGILADSAGGNIAFGMALMARDKKVPLPGAIVTYAPWLDIEQTSKTYFDKERIDQTVILTPLVLESARDAAFGKQDSYSPYISPSKGNYNEGFSSVAVAIYAAGRDLLRQEGEELAENLRSKAKSVESFCKEGLWHGYQEHYGMPESMESAEKAATFMQHHLSSEKK